MCEADHRHFSRHHRIWCSGDFFQCFQQHLPHPGQNPHRQGLCHVLATGAFIRADGGVFCRVRGDFHH